MTPPTTKFTNYEAINDLDSSQAFEGPEKTLRIHFHTSKLLDIERSTWEAVLNTVHCKILSVLIRPEAHAYILSESSLFVYPSYIMLKTCGTTTLLHGISPIITAVTNLPKTNTDVVKALFYTRRSYFFPEKQQTPHTCWQSEVEFLKKTFSANTFSFKTGSDCHEQWHFFSVINTSQLAHGWLELMMSDISHECSSKFHVHSSSTSSLESSISTLSSTCSVASKPDDDDPGHDLGHSMSHQGCIDHIFNTKNQCIDSFAFQPCGYSCNALLNTNEYFTVHITPEIKCSYASFETNVSNPSDIEQGLTFKELSLRVLNLFKPRIVHLVCVSQNLAEFQFQGYKVECLSSYDIGPLKIMQIELIRC